MSTTRHRISEQGQLLLLVLVMGAVLLTVVVAFVGFVITQNKVVNMRVTQQQATEIAEAGLNYYRWYLAHNEGDFTHGTGLPGPYVEQYFDPESPDTNPIGEFSLAISSRAYCGAVSAVEITSTGYTYQDPGVEASITARYSRPTVAEYSFITNGATWYGDSRVITGPVHSNNAIKMDGVHNSQIGSGIASWSCNSNFGCSPTVSNAGGVYSNSGLATPGLFQFPVSAIDFGGMMLDLSEMKSRAQNNGGIYYPDTSGYGYWARFRSNGTVDVYRVTNTRNYESYSTEEGWHTGERNAITNSTFLASHTIDPDCPLLFFEDKLWLEGAINQKVAVGASDLTPTGNVNIVIEDNVTYVPGTDAGLVAIAQRDVDVGLVVPNNMIANGIYIAQLGRFGRNHYRASDLDDWGLDQYVSRDSLTRLGSVISNGRVGTEWTSGGAHSSGFRNRITSFDRNQVDDPPPLTPETSAVYRLTNWRQEG